MLNQLNLLATTLRHAGIIGDDLVENTLYASVLTEGYAARVNNLRNYVSVSLDVLRRWLYPIVPDDEDGGDRDGFRRHRDNVYKCTDAQLSP